MTTLITILAILGLIVIGYFVYKWLNREIREIHHLNLQKRGLVHIPAVPYTLNLGKMIKTLLNLTSREKEMQQAQNGLSNTYEIDGHSENGFTYLYGEEGHKKRQEALEKLKDSLKHPLLGRKRLEDHLDHVPKDIDSIHVPVGKHQLTQLSLEKPKQFSMSWTEEGGIFKRASEQFLTSWAATLETPEQATQQFWPTIAKYGLPYNLLILQKIDQEKLSSLQIDFQNDWTDEMTSLQQNEQLYAIDMRIFANFQPQKVHDFIRFTPSTFILLKQDKTSKSLEPFAIWVAGYQGADQKLYTPKDPTWLYALQAAKTSITVYGIWLGHVYHWHMVSAAMQMTRHNVLGEDHPISVLLAPQSNYLIEFDVVLLLLWKNIAPPTSFSTSRLFLELSDTFANGRQFFDDDPKTTLTNFGINKTDFTKEKPWDQFPVAGQLLEIWDAAEAYINTFVEHSYKDDQDVIHDADLQKWIKVSGDPYHGNVKGLPKMNSKKALKAVLTSLVFRITAHGCSRLNHAANPALTFTANYPPCLQNQTLPEIDKTIDTKTLLTYLPKTGTIGEMMKFYNTFSYSAPYEPFLPINGIDSDLFFPGGKSDPRNEALITFRGKVKTFIETFEEEAPQIHQWPMNIET